MNHRDQAWKCFRCAAEIPYAEKEAHKKTCLEKPVRCPWCLHTCPWKGRHYIMREHRRVVHNEKNIVGDPWVEMSQRVTQPIPPTRKPTSVRRPDAPSRDNSLGDYRIPRRTSAIDIVSSNARNDPLEGTSSNHTCKYCRKAVLTEGHPTEDRCRENPIVKRERRKRAKETKREKSAHFKEPRRPLSPGPSTSKYRKLSFQPEKLRAKAVAKLQRQQGINTPIGDRYEECFENSYFGTYGSPGAESPYNEDEEHCVIDDPETEIDSAELVCEAPAEVTDRPGLDSAELMCGAPTGVVDGPEIVNTENRPEAVCDSSVVRNLLRNLVDLVDLLIPGPAPTEVTREDSPEHAVSQEQTPTELTPVLVIRPRRRVSVRTIYRIKCRCCHVRRKHCHRYMGPRLERGHRVRPYGLRPRRQPTNRGLPVCRVGPSRNLPISNQPSTSAHHHQPPPPFVTQGQPPVASITTSQPLRTTVTTTEWAPEDTPEDVPRYPDYLQLWCVETVTEHFTRTTTYEYYSS